MATVAELAGRGVDTRLIRTVNRANASDGLKLLELADELGVSLVKYHVFSVIGRGHANPDWAMPPREWIAFYEHREQVAGCVGRALDRISVFPDGRCYVCSYLFDTNLHLATFQEGQVARNHGPNEFDLFTQVLARPSCGRCKEPASCTGGCPAEAVVMGSSSCTSDPDTVPVCRLWQATIT